MFWSDDSFNSDGYANSTTKKPKGGLYTHCNPSMYPFTWVMFKIIDPETPWQLQWVFNAESYLLHLHTCLMLGAHVVHYDENHEQRVNPTDVLSHPSDSEDLCCFLPCRGPCRHPLPVVSVSRFDTWNMDIGHGARSSRISVSAIRIGWLWATWSAALGPYDRIRVRRVLHGRFFAQIMSTIARIRSERSPLRCRAFSEKGNISSRVEVWMYRGRNGSTITWELNHGKYRWL